MVLPGWMRGAGAFLKALLDLFVLAVAQVGFIITFQDSNGIRAANSTALVDTMQRVGFLSQTAGATAAAGKGGTSASPPSPASVTSSSAGPASAVRLAGNACLVSCCNAAARLCPSCGTRHVSSSLQGRSQIFTEAIASTVAALRPSHLLMGTLAELQRVCIITHGSWDKVVTLTKDGQSWMRRWLRCTSSTRCSR